MAALGAQTVASSYEQLLHTDTDGGGNGNTLVTIKDGDNGTTFGLKLATNKVEVIPGSNDANAFEVSQADGTAVFTVDTSTPSATFTSDVFIAENIKHTGDTDTRIRMLNDNVIIYAGNENQVDIGNVITVFNEGGGDNDLRIESENNANMFYVDASTDRIGIGESSPGSTLDVKSGEAANTANFNSTSGATNITLESSGSLIGQIEFASSGTSQIVTRTSASLGLGSNNVKTLYITDDDRVGIGTTSPAYTFDLASSDAIVSQFTGSSGETILSLDNTSTNGDKWYLISGGSGGSFAGGKFGIYNADTTTAVATFTNDGKVGIGTASPESQLTFSTVAFSSSADSGIRVQNPDTTADAVIQHYENSDLVDWFIGANAQVNTSGSQVRFNTTKESAAITVSAANGHISFTTSGTGANPTSSMLINNAGVITQARQPAFLATPDGTQSNPGNNTKIEFNTEIFDQGGNFSNDTFTAPVTGRYQFNCVLRTNGGFDTATDYQGFQLVTSNRSYTTEVDPDIFDSSGGFYTFQLSVLADMDASDTAKVNHFFNAGTVTLDIISTSSFSGYLAC